MEAIKYLKSKKKEVQFAVLDDTNTNYNETTQLKNTSNSRPD